MCEVSELYFCQMCCPRLANQEDVPSATGQGYLVQM